MSDVTATLRLESPDLPLTETLARAGDTTVQPVTGAGTGPTLGGHLFTVRTDDFDRFESALDRDPTIDAFERVVAREGEAVYSFEYAAQATVFSGAISAANGVSLEWANDGTSWTVRVWLPEREALASLWEFASEHDVDFSLERVSDYAGTADVEFGLTPDQREAIGLALEMGYFEEPRGATLEEVAAELGISQPAAGGRLRRGIRRLVVATVAVGDEGG